MQTKNVKIVDFKTTLKKHGFELIEENECVTAYYDYSDFELLSFNIRAHTKVKGDKCIAIDNFTLYNPIAMSNNENEPPYINIDYTLYFDSIDKLFELLSLLNYRINVKNI